MELGCGTRDRSGHSGQDGAACPAWVAAGSTGTGLAPLPGLGSAAGACPGQEKSVKLKQSRTTKPVYL